MMRVLLIALGIGIVVSALLTRYFAVGRKPRRTLMEEKRDCFGDSVAGYHVTYPAQRHRLRLVNRRAIVRRKSA